MWSSGIIVLLSASTMAALATTLTTETALMLLMENLAWTHDTATLMLGVTGFLVTLFAVAAARAVDQLTTPTMSLCASVATALARACLALLLTYDRELAAILVVPLFMFILALDAVLVLQSITLCLNNQIARAFFTIAKEHQSAQTARVFGVHYSLGNLAALVAAVGYDFLRTYTSTVGTANVIIQWCGLAANLFTISLLLLATQVSTGPTLKPPPPPSSSCWADVRELMGDTRLWRFVVFCLLLLPVASIFRHLNLTLPVLMQRQFDEKVHFAAVQAINPGVVVLLAWVFQWLTARYRSYWVIVGGTALSSLSILPLIIAGGHATHHAAVFLNYLPFIVFMLVFSVGEALWSARYTTYVMQAAPEEKKAFYIAIAAIPQMGARLLVAWHSAWLVAYHCPSAQHCDPREIWWTVWGLSCITPAGLLIGFHWLDPSTSVTTS